MHLAFCSTQHWTYRDDAVSLLCKLHHKVEEAVSSATSRRKTDQWTEHILWTSLIQDPWLFIMFHCFLLGIEERGIELKRAFYLLCAWNYSPKLSIRLFRLEHPLCMIQLAKTTVILNTSSKQQFTEQTFSLQNDIT